MTLWVGMQNSKKKPCDVIQGRPLNGFDPDLNKTFILLSGKKKIAFYATS